MERNYEEKRDHSTRIEDDISLRMKPAFEALIKERKVSMSDEDFHSIFNRLYEKLSTNIGAEVVGILSDEEFKSKLRGALVEVYEDTEREMKVQALNRSNIGDVNKKAS